MAVMFAAVVTVCSRIVGGHDNGVGVCVEHSHGVFGRKMYVLHIG